jgi:two-component system, CitB family, sensor kinase
VPEDFSTLCALTPKVHVLCVFCNRTITQPGCRFRRAARQWHSAAGHSWTLTTQIVLASLWLLLTIVLGRSVFHAYSSQTLDRQFQLRGPGVVTTTALVPEIRSALGAGDPRHIVDGLAQEITAAARSASVVVTDRNDIRFSHPNPGADRPQTAGARRRTGRQDTPGVRQGQPAHVSKCQAPDLRGGRLVIGQVSVGIGETKVLDNRNIWLIAGSSALFLALSVGVSLQLSRRIRGVTR